ncbi:hypothetical protein MMC31_002406 [Peltigera leucophlebia]|nr:hypothetical protein [Peltigera leucophlebia]
MLSSEQLPWSGMAIVNNLVRARKYQNAIHNRQFPSRTDLRTERETDGLGLHLNAPDKTMSASPRLEHISEPFGPGDDCQHIFLHTSFVATKNDGTAYYGSLPTEERDRSPASERVSQTGTKGRYIPHVSLWFYPGLKFLDEARTIELIRHNPHPNIAHFASYIVESDRIVGLALTRHTIELGDRIRNGGSIPLDKASCLHGIVAGLEHLHSLGLAHNNLYR